MNEGYNVIKKIELLQKRHDYMTYAFNAPEMLHTHVL